MDRLVTSTNVTAERECQMQPPISQSYEHICLAPLLASSLVHLAFDHTAAPFGTNASEDTKAEGHPPSVACHCYDHCDCVDHQQYTHTSEDLSEYVELCMVAERTLRS